MAGRVVVVGHLKSYVDQPLVVNDAERSFNGVSWSRRVAKQPKIIGDQDQDVGVVVEVLAQALDATELVREVLAEAVKGVHLREITEVPLEVLGQRTDERQGQTSAGLV